LTVDRDLEPAEGIDGDFDGRSLGRKKIEEMSDAILVVGISPLGGVTLT